MGSHDWFTGFGNAIEYRTIVDTTIVMGLCFVAYVRTALILLEKK